jgi:peptidoglycan/xylan/chitin deacetylase (PgdA/CDA1 family)/SAM-dependent methyltransferase
VPVSVVIPARDAEATLRETLASLQAQTFADWEAVLVDDGSTDGTARLARTLADDDPRIRVLTGTGSGVGAARNLGLAEARHDRVLFLDADDLLRPAALELLGSELDRDADLAGAYCGWARLAPDGRTVGELDGHRTDELFRDLAYQCLFPIHACLVRTELVRGVGGFDPGLVTCEDWDLWLRLARLGRPFAVVPDILALYRMRERSASVDGRRMLEDGLAVLARARRPDPRVTAPASAYADGRRTDDLAETRLLHACWCAGLVLGAGGDARELLAVLRAEPAPGLVPEAVAHCLFVSALLPRCLTPADWPALWPEVQRHTVAFLAALEETSRTPQLALRTRRVLERQIIAAAPPGGSALGAFRAVVVDVEQPVGDVPLEPGVERLLCRVVMGGEELGVVELPACDGCVPAAAIEDAIASELAWPILRRFFGHDEETHDADGWTVLLRELFGLADWPPERFYDWDAHLPATATANRDAVELSEELPDLRAPAGALDVHVTTGGAALGTVRVTASGGVVRAGRLVAAVATEAGFELARLAVREGVLGRPRTDAGTLRAALAARARSRRAEPAAEAADDLVLCRRRPYELGGSASRVAVLPAGAAADLTDACAAAGEAVQRPAGGPRRVSYDPRVLPAAPPEVHVAMNGSRPTEAYFDAVFAERADPWDYTNAYELTKYQQTLDLLPRGPGQALEVGCAEGRFTERLASIASQVVAADISQVALERAQARCAELPNVDFVQLDVAADPLPGDYDLIVCSEVLYYLDDHAELDRVAAKLAQALRPGGCLVTAHAHVVSDQPGRPGFVWDVPFGARAIGMALQRTGGLRLEEELRTPFYRVQRLRRPKALRRLWRRRKPNVTSLPQPTPLPLHVAATARWEGIGGETATAQVPILMYHRVASGGPSPLGRYRLSPDRFADQLRVLREAGCRTVGFAELGRALAARRPLPGRVVVLTFDDGSRDFLTDAWPLLREHGLGATLFVVTDHVGGTNDWDAAYGEPVELLDWDELRYLARAGIEIGSHTATHPFLTTLSAEDVAREAARSRTALLRELGVEPIAIAYPYGDVDAGVRRIVGGVGYGYGVTVEGRRARLVDDPLELPRIEVMDTFTADELRRVLGL